MQPVPIYNPWTDADMMLGDIPMASAEPSIKRQARVWVALTWVLDGLQYTPWAVYLAARLRWYEFALLVAPLWLLYALRLALLAGALVTMRNCYAMCSELLMNTEGAKPLFPLRRAFTLITGDTNLHGWCKVVLVQTLLLVPVLLLHIPFGG
ncbi:MAG TPA: hypothetical protein VKD22_14205, partial [Ramlibacter sp.]|nr:hypothetical protein [Ramlibacter sp.]